MLTRQQQSEGSVVVGVEGLRQLAVVVLHAVTLVDYHVLPAELCQHGLVSYHVLVCGEEHVQFQGPHLKRRNIQNFKKKGRKRSITRKN